MPPKYPFKLLEWLHLWKQVEYNSKFIHWVYKMGFSLLSSSVNQKFFFALVAILLFAGCAVTKHVPDDMYLLNKVEIKTNSKDIKPYDIESYVKQMPNKRILGFRFHLRVYSLSNPNRSGWINRGLRSIGEDPVLFDSLRVSESSRNILLLLQSKGYYNAKVSDSVRYHGKKVDVYYRVEPNLPYQIRKIGYYIEDSLIRKLVIADTANRLFKSRDLFDIDVLQNERDRLELMLKRNGYYTFSKNFITFTADTNLRTNKADLNFIIKNPQRIDETGVPKPDRFKRYRIRNIYIYPNYDPFRFSSYRDKNELDTVDYSGCKYIFHNDAGIKLEVISSFNQLREGDLYSVDNVTKTQQNLSQIRLFKFVSISFNEVEVLQRPDTLNLLPDDKPIGEEFGYLDCHIQMVPHTLQSYQVELVGTNTTGSLGAEGTFNYQHKNLFRGAEVFDVKFRGLVETAQQRINMDNTLELGGAVSLTTPKFIGPYSSKVQVDKYAPNTQITASYSFQRRPEYTRIIAGLQYGYTWRGSRFVTHTFNPVELNAISIQKISPEFQAQIDSTFLRYSYISQIVTVTSYNWVFSNQNIKKSANYAYIRYNLELSGNLLNAFSQLTNMPKNTDGAYAFWGTEFSQFIRSDINFTYHQVADENNSFAYRLFVGVGYPYGNSKALPFEKRYFTGGANGIRAWQARSLGPGSYYMPAERFPNRTADIKLEANFEYRFKMVWKLEGALFVDAGNIWSLPGLDDREGAEFRWGKFYEQIALGSGLGIRMNLGFFILRTDFGYKIYDPAINPNEPFKPWVPFNRRFSIRDVTFNFGIGYPF